MNEKHPPESNASHGTVPGIALETTVGSSPRKSWATWTGPFQGPMDQTGVITWHQPKQCTIIENPTIHLHCLIPCQIIQYFYPDALKFFQNRWNKKERERERERFSLPSFCRSLHSSRLIDLTSRIEICRLVAVIGLTLLKVPCPTITVSYWNQTCGYPNLSEAWQIFTPPDFCWWKISTPSKNLLSSFTLGDHYITYTTLHILYYTPTTLVLQKIQGCVQGCILHVRGFTIFSGYTTAWVI